MYATNQFRKGLKIEIDGVPFEMIFFQHISPGKGSAFTRTKLRNMLTGNVVDRTFKSGEKVDKANVTEQQMQFLYQDSDGFHFMNTSNYEQVALTEEHLSGNQIYLQENLKVDILFFNDRAIGVTFPNFVELVVEKTEPAVKGDTVSGASKPATMNTGAVVNVPLHIKEGDMLKVDTRTGDYSEKVNR